MNNFWALKIKNSSLKQRGGVYFKDIVNKGHHFDILIDSFNCRSSKNFYLKYLYNKNSFFYLG